MALFSAGHARASDGDAGDYRLVGEHDAVGELLLRRDGTFAYGFSEGALDEHAEGRWVESEHGLTLTTVPTPKPPVIVQAKRDAPAPGAPTLIVTTPNGRGVGGDDFRIRFASGDPVVDYTQFDGWTLPPDEHRQMVWIELYEPIYEVRSARFMIAPGETGTLRFVLVPNDMGVVDFAKVPIHLEGYSIIMHRGARTLHFERTAAGHLRNR